jgi:hypothetical protein
MPSEFVATTGQWARRETPPDPETTEWLYEVKIGVMVGLTCPPDHPEILVALYENALDRLQHGGPEDVDLIDSFELIEVQEARTCPATG